MAAAKTVNAKPVVTAATVNTRTCRPRVVTAPPSTAPPGWTTARGTIPSTLCHEYSINPLP